MSKPFANTKFLSGHFNNYQSTQKLQGKIDMAIKTKMSAQFQDKPTPMINGLMIIEV